MDENYKMSV